MSDELKKIEKELENIKSDLQNPYQEQHILKQANDLNNIIQEIRTEAVDNNINPDEAEKVFVKNKLEEYGISKENINKYFELRANDVNKNYKLADGQDFFSKIFDEIRIYVIEQIPKPSQVRFPLLQYLKTRYWPNGNTSFWYNDNTTPFSFVKPSQTTNTRVHDFNGEVANPFVEVFDTPLISRKSMDILNVYLNDFVRSSALFVTLINNYYLLFTREEERLMFQIARRLVTGTYNVNMINNLTNPQNNLLPVDYSTYTPDIIISENSFKGALKSLNNLLISLQAPRRRAPNPDYIPNGSSLYLERNVNIEKLIMIMPNQFQSKIQFDILSNLYNAEKLNLPVKIVPMDYQGVFEENRGINNLKYTENEADIFLFNPDTYELGIHYKATVSEKTPVLKTVYNQFQKMGVSFDKREYSYKIRLIVTSFIQTDVEAINVFKGTTASINITNYDALVADNGTLTVSFNGAKGTATLMPDTKSISITSTNDSLDGEQAEVVISSSKSDVEKRVVVNLYNTQVSLTQADLTFSAVETDYQTVTLANVSIIQNIQLDWDKKYLVDVKYFTLPTDGKIYIRSQGSTGVITFTISSPNLSAPATFKVTLV